MPGRRLCKTTCADLQTDAQNCGDCGHACSAGEACVHGACRPPGVSALAITPKLTATPPFAISYTNGSDECLWDHTEAAPERAAVAGQYGYGRFFVAYNGDENNWATTYDSWGVSEHHSRAAINPNWGTSVIGDPSVTTSDFTGENYLGYIAHRDIDGSLNYCQGIAVATSDDLPGNTFEGDNGVECTTPGYYADGPSIKYDLEGTDLWAGYDESTFSGKPYDYPVVDIMEDCGPGQPGCCTNGGQETCTYTCAHDATHPCPVTSHHAYDQPGQEIDIDSHVSVAVNPCTHNGIMVYVTADGKLQIRAWRPDGTEILVQTIDSDVHHDSNDVCCAEAGTDYPDEIQTCNDQGTHYCDTSDSSDCVQGSQGHPCMRMAIHPHIVTNEISLYDTGGEPAARCYAYIAYNTSGVGSDGHTYYTAKLQVRDITHDTNSSPPWLVTSYRSKDPTTTAYNDFEPEVAAAGYYVAWGYYSQVLSPCATDFEIYEDNFGALSSINNRFSPSISGYFPTMRHADYGGNPYETGFGDYVETISRGVGPGGQLFMSWAQPVCMDTGSPSCIACNTDGCRSGQWSIVDKGAVITP